MFTGIIEETGIIKEIRKNGSATLNIKAKKILSEIKFGDSIAVNGICLTVNEYSKDSFKADLTEETVSKTSFNSLKKGDCVNLERAVKIGQRLDGHIVTGHIDGTGIITGKLKSDNSTVMKIAAEQEILNLLVKKGSVSIDGISLTVNDVENDYFSVSIIPTTNEVTTLSCKKVNDLVNIETDIIGKYVSKLLSFNIGKNKSKEKNKINLEFLSENGFIK